MTAKAEVAKNIPSEGGARHSFGPSPEMLQLLIVTPGSKIWRGCLAKNPTTSVNLIETVVQQIGTESRTDWEQNRTEHPRNRGIKRYVSC